MAGRHVPLEVNVEHGIPLVLGDVEAHRVAQDARVVHEDVETAEPLGRFVHDGVAAVPRCHVARVRDCLTTAGPDLRDDFVGGFAVEVVHDDVGAFACEEPCVAASDAARRARDDRDLAVEDAHEG